MVDNHAFELFIEAEHDATEKAASLRVRGLTVELTPYVGGFAVSISGPAAEMQVLQREVLAERRSQERFVLHGVVRWWNDEKGCGRITGDDGYIYFCHFSSLQMDGYRSLREGQRVEFEGSEGMADHGRAGALNVRVIGET